MTVKNSMYKDKNFNILVWGGGTSLIGSYVVYMVMVWYVLDKSEGAYLLGLVMAASTLVPALLSSFIGSYIDRKDCKQLIIRLDIGQGIFFLAFAAVLLVWGNNLYFVLFILFVVSIFNVMYSLALTALYPSLFDQAGLQKATSINVFLHSMTNIVGVALAGVLITVLDIPWILLINGVTFLISAFFERFLEIKFQAERVLTGKGLNFRRDFKEAIGEIKRLKMVGYFVHSAGLNLACVGIFYIGFPYVYKEVFQLNAEAFSLANTVLLAGMMLATFLFTFAPAIKDGYRFMNLNLYTQGGLLALMGLVLWFGQGSGGLIGFLIVVFLFGAINSIATVPARTLIMKKVPGDLIGKVFGVKHSFNTGANALSNLLFGILFDTVSAGTVFLIAGIGFIFVNLFNRPTWYQREE